MKVLFVAEYFPPKIMGGGEINLFLLAKALAKRKVEVGVLTSYHSGLKRYEKIEEVKVYRRLKTAGDVTGIFSNFKRSFVFPRTVVKEVLRLKKEAGFDVVHLIGTSLIAAKEIMQTGKVFATVESYPSLCPKGDRIYYGRKECTIKCSFLRFVLCQQKCSEIGKMQNKFYLKYNPLFLAYVYAYYKKLNKSLRYCRIVAISKYVQALLKMHKVESRVIPNAIDASKFYSNKRKSGKTRVVYLGSLTKYKGAHILLKSLKGLDCRCDIYGEGIMKDALNEMIRKNGLDAEIHNNVPYEKVPSIYANADVVVFPSVWPEPFGRISIEAMAAGKPVIGSAVGGIKETIDGKWGAVVKAGDVLELHNALKRLIEDKKMRVEMGNAGRKAVVNYSEEKVIGELVRYYSEMLKK